MANDKLLNQLAVLEDMAVVELKQKFFELYRFNCGDAIALTIRKRIAYKLQEIAFGGLSDEDKKYLDFIADNDPMANLVIDKKNEIPVKSMRLTREWKGKKYEVVSNGDGSYRYKGNNYTSLSAIAREITGTRWNGKVFFGVKK